MDPMIDEFGTVAAGMAVGKPTIPLVSNVTGQLAGRRLRLGGVLEATRARGGAIRRQRAFRALGRRKPVPRSRAGQRPDGIDRRNADASDPMAAPVIAMSALRKDRPEPRPCSTPSRRGSSRAMEWTGAVRWAAADLVELPTYAFQRRRFWLAGGVPPTDAVGPRPGGRSTRCSVRSWRCPGPVEWC